MFPSIKMEENMEPELSGIFRVKMVTKSIVLGSPREPILCIWGLMCNCSKNFLKEHLRDQNKVSA